MMKAKTKTGIALLWVIVVGGALLFGSTIAAAARSEGFGMRGSWGDIVWVLAPPLLMISLFVLLVWVIFMQKD